MAWIMLNEMNIKFINYMKKKISTMNKIEIERKNGTKNEYININMYINNLGTVTR